MGSKKQFIYGSMVIVAILCVVKYGEYHMPREVVINHQGLSFVEGKWTPQKATISIEGTAYPNIVKGTEFVGDIYLDEQVVAVNTTSYNLGRGDEYPQLVLDNRERLFMQDNFQRIVVRDYDDPEERRIIIFPCSDIWNGMTVVDEVVTDPFMESSALTFLECWQRMSEVKFCKIGM